MSEAGRPTFDPIAIGAVATPPFARAPDPATHFRRRAQRYAVVARTSPLAPFLHFMAGLAEAQHQCQFDLPAPDMPSGDERERARAYAMPPLGNLQIDGALDATFDRFFVLAGEVDMPAEARRALEGVTHGSSANRHECARRLLDREALKQNLAEGVFVAAALQVHFVRRAALLDARALVPVGDGACPACGGAPVASLVVGWTGAHGVRFCACWLCSTLWHVARVKCVLCGATDGIAYEEIENGPGAGEVRAETCANCRHYVKIMLQDKNPALDPFADDAATLALDMLLREGGWRRGGVNPLLLGF
jgi:FdhE protein